MKDDSNYLIGTHGKGLILVKRGKEIYSELLPQQGQRLWDMVYASAQDCYFLCHHEKLWKKTNDNKPPTKYLNIEFGFRLTACMRYSPKGGILVVNADGKKLTVISSEAQRTLMRVPTCRSEFIHHFEVFGSNESKIIYMNRQGEVGVSKFDLRRNSSSNLFSTKVQLKEELNEELLSVSVCSKNQLACVCLATQGGISLKRMFGDLLGGLGSLLTQRKPNFIPKATRHLIFEIKESSLDLKASLDCFQEEIGRFHALSFYDYIGDRALFVGLSSDNGDVHLLDYNTSSREFKELYEKRVSSSEEDPVQILKFNDRFYYTGRSISGETHHQSEGISL